MSIYIINSIYLIRVNVEVERVNLIYLRKLMQKFLIILGKGETESAEPLIG